MCTRLIVLNTLGRYSTRRAVGAFHSYNNFRKNIQNDLNNNSLLNNTSKLNKFSRTKFNKKIIHSENQDSDDENVNDAEYAEEKDSKIMKVKINSLRADLIVKAGLGMARNKVEINFYEGKVRLNGKKISKKSIQLNIDDEIDIIKGFSHINPAHLLVSRVQILSGEVDYENITVTLRRYKGLIIENYEGLVNDCSRFNMIGTLYLITPFFNEKKWKR